MKKKVCSDKCIYRSPTVSSLRDVHNQQSIIKKVNNTHSYDVVCTVRSTLTALHRWG